MSVEDEIRQREADIQAVLWVFLLAAGNIREVRLLAGAAAFDRLILDLRGRS